ncbi:MAG TPA: hypothetical protein VH500_22675 [Nitrososphaeraceae archaeon]
MIERHKEFKIVGTLYSCIDSNCSGWIVDTLTGKYWIKCMDARHDNQQDKSKASRPYIEAATGQIQRSKSQHPIQRCNNYGI